MPTDDFNLTGYYARVHRTPMWREMHVGMARYAGLVPERAGLRVLDLGCGPGGLAAQLHAEGFRVTGVDTAFEALRLLQQLDASVPATQARGERLPFPPSTFDVALAGNMLFYLQAPEVVLREMARVTRAGGVVAVWNPSESMTRVAAAMVAAATPGLSDLERRHLVNWAEIAEAACRWGPPELVRLFAAAELVEFETEPLLHGLARYARGVVAG